LNKKYAIGVIVATTVAIGIVVWLSHGESSPRGSITGNVSQNESISTSSPVGITKILSNATGLQSSNQIKNAPLLFEAWPGQYDVVFPLFQKYLRSGDSVFIQGSNPSGLQGYMINYFAPAVNVQIVKLTGNLQNIATNSGSWPAGYDVWRYIYENEPQYEPQFKANQTQAMQLWDKARQYMAAYNTRTGSHAKLWVVASWPETSDAQIGLAPWNWATAQQHTDLLTVEVQRWQETDLQRSINAVQQVRNSGAIGWQAQASMETDNGHTLAGALALIHGTYGTPGISSWEPFYSNNYKGLYTFLQYARGSNATSAGLVESVSASGSTENATTQANSTAPPPSHAQYQNVHFVFIAWESQYSKSLPILQKYLKAGDSLFLQTKHSDRDASYKSNYFASGVNVYLVRRTFGIQDMMSNSSSWPSGYDLWEYDYEKGDKYEPQFTADQAEAEKLFDQARQYLQEYNQRTHGHANLWITPSYPEVNGENWNWGKAQQHTDLMLVQVQRWQETDAPRSIAAAQHVAESAGSWIEQASIAGQHTVSGALNLINSTSGFSGIKAYLVFYGNNYDGLQAFLQQVR